MKTAAVTAHLNEELVAKLDAIAATSARSRDWIVARALEAYVDQREAFTTFLQAGEDSIEKGDYLTQQEMETWFAARRKTADAA